MQKITDPIDRIIKLVFEAQAGMTMNEFCLPGCRDEVRRRVGQQIEIEFEQWFQAKVELLHLDGEL